MCKICIALFCRYSTVVLTYKMAAILTTLISLMWLLCMMKREWESVLIESAYTVKKGKSSHRAQH